MTSRTRRALVGLGIGLALADSSVVTLALPDILRQFDVEIPQVAWVLTSYNLGLALAAVPAAYAARRRPVPAFVAGTLVFAAASLACALAPSFGVLVGARCVQAVGGALLVCAALDLLTEIEGERRARGPHLGVGRHARRGARARPRRDPHGDAGLGVDLPRPGAARPRDARRRSPAPGARRSWCRRVVRTSLRTSRCCSSPAALTAALFLLVLLLVDGWRYRAGRRGG